MPTEETHKGLSLLTATSGSGGTRVMNAFRELANRTPPCNFAATRDPYITDDVNSNGGAGQGYYIGSRWVNTTTGSLWECRNNTVGAARWVDVGGLSVLNVKTFGAIGDGINDDTISIQAALDLAQNGAERGEVFFPRGYYRITKMLTLYKSAGVKITGVGNSGGTESYILGYASQGRDTGSVLIWDGIDESNEDQALSNITRSGVVATATSSSAHGLNVNDLVSVQGAVESEFNNQHATVASVPSTTTFTYAVANSGATVSTGTRYFIAEKNWAVLLCLYGSNANCIEDMTFLGRKINNVGNRARACIMQNSTDDYGWPAGVSYFKNISTSDSKYGVQLDDEELGTNCADNVFITCHFAHADAGIYISSTQSLNNTIFRCDFNECEIAIHHVFGGDTQVFGASMNGFTGGVFLRSTGGGTNASSFALYGVRLESDMGYPVLLDAGYAGGNGGVQNVSIDSFSWVGNNFPNDWLIGTTYSINTRVASGYSVWNSLQNSNTGNTPPPGASNAWWQYLGVWKEMITVGPLCNCTVRNSSFKGRPSFRVNGASGQWATLRIEHCRVLDSSTVNSSLSTNGINCFWKSIDCTGQSGYPIVNEGNWPV